jgi:hypothetical protein
VIWEGEKMEAVEPIVKGIVIVAILFIVVRYGLR